MYIVAVPLELIAVKYAFGTNVKISSVLGNRGNAVCELVTTTALFVASAEVLP
jgi:hypothetical protein